MYMNKYKGSISETIHEKLKKLQEIKNSMIDIETFPVPVVPGTVNLILASGHNGKTTHGISTAFCVAREGKGAFILSTEEDEYALLDKTRGISPHDEIWDRIGFGYKDVFDAQTLETAIFNVIDAGYDALIIDYLKLSMWKNYSSDHITIEEIMSTIIKALNAHSRKISVFAYIQGNRTALDFNKYSNEELAQNPTSAALMAAGGMSAYRSAENMLMLRQHDGKRYMIVVKARRHPHLLGNIETYDINLMNYKFSKNTELFSKTTGERKIYNRVKFDAK